MTKKCKSCQTEIDSKANKCPHCQSDQRNWFRKHPILTVIVGLFILGLFGTAIGGSNKSTPATSDTTTVSATTVSATTQPTATQVAMKELLNLTGSGTKSTQKFSTSSDWDLNWTYDCSNFGQKGNFQVMIYNGDGSMSIENGAVNQLGSKDSGVEHYHKGGTYYLEVNSECSWTVQVKG
jgi:hypothetical protein